MTKNSIKIMGVTEGIFNDTKPYKLKVKIQSNFENFIFVLDLYLLENPTHEVGHLGFYVYQLTEKCSEFLVYLNKSGIQLTCKALKKINPISTWKNETLVNYENLKLIAVLREKVTNKIIDDYSLPIFRGKLNHEKYRQPVINYFNQKHFNLDSFLFI